MEFAFQDEFGHQMLNALRELGEGINKLTALERNLSSCGPTDLRNSVSLFVDLEDFDVMKIMNSVTSPTKARINAELSPDDSQSVSGIEQELPPSPIQASLRSESPIDLHEEENDCFESQTPALDRDSLCSDEWENDDDLGYVTVQLTEQEFFEMEEEVMFRHSLGRDVNQGIRTPDCVIKSYADQLTKPSKSEEGSSTQSQEYEHYRDDELNQSFRRNDGVHDPSYRVVSLDLRAQSPELSIEKVEKAVETLDLSEGEEIDLDNDLEEYCKQPIERLPPEDTGNPAPIAQMGSLYSFGNPNPSRRETEIWGQRKILGVDGEHRYFDLKVIFEPYRTGFEEDKNFNPVPGTIVAGRYEVAEMLGQAAFSTAWQCVDLNADGTGNEWVCLKVIKNSKDFFDQSLDEIKLLQYINSKGDPHKHNVLKMIDFFYCKEHLFIVSELLRENLYEFGKYIRESGAKEYFTLPRLKKITKQILEALVYIHSLNLIHCDIKPENIVIRSYSRCEVKLIDFGSSCFITDHLTSYIQSRSYRAPEVILGLDYGPRIDIWSLGSVLAEMHTGYVLFQNDSIATMLARIQGILGPFPPHMLDSGREVERYFSSSRVIFERSEDSEGNFSTTLVYPKKTSLRHRLQLPHEDHLTDDETRFLDFTAWMLQLDPDKRPLAGQALLHPWFDDVDLLDVSYVDT